MSHTLTVSNPEFGDQLDQNYTYNYQPIFEKFGMRSLSNLHGMRADDAEPILRYVVAEVEAMTEEEFNEVVRGHGTWGDKTSLLENLTTLVDYLKKHPTSVWISVY